MQNQGRIIMTPKKEKVKKEMVSFRVNEGAVRILNEYSELMSTPRAQLLEQLITAENCLSIARKKKEQLEKHLS